MFWFLKKNIGIATLRSSWEKENGWATRGLEKRMIWVSKDFFSKSRKTARGQKARIYQVNRPLQSSKNPYF